MSIRISVYREAGTLAFYNTAYICFIHICHYLHLCQVGRNSEEVGVSNPEATVCPASTSRLMTTPSIGEVIVA